MTGSIVAKLTVDNIDANNREELIESNNMDLKILAQKQLLLKDFKLLLVRQMIGICQS